MQYPSPNATDLIEIEKAIKPIRLQRYMPAAGQSKVKAFEFYRWNCDLCEAFHLPVQFTEVAVRNCIQAAIESKWGAQWYNSGVFYKILDRYYQDELNRVIQKENAQHGLSMTSDHIASSLSFGFIEHMVTKRFAQAFWKKGVTPFFPGAPASKGYVDLFPMIQDTRRFRNRIAHHEAIFDKRPAKVYSEMMVLLEWASPVTATWLQSVSQVNQVINRRP